MERKERKEKKQNFFEIFKISLCVSNYSVRRQIIYLHVLIEHQNDENQKFDYDTL